MELLLDFIGTALLPRYVVESEIGRGTMAVVLLARDTKHDRPVAIKVLSPELTDAIGAQRFQREIEVVAGLNHPNILPLHDSGEAGGFAYYVMPYLSGGSLRHRIEREGTWRRAMLCGSCGKSPMHSDSRIGTASSTAM